MKKNEESEINWQTFIKMENFPVSSFLFAIEFDASTCWRACWAQALQIIFLILLSCAYSLLR